MVICGRSGARLAEAAEQSRRARAHLDVADRGAVEALVRDVVSELGGLDALVANAGVDGRWDRIQDLPTEAFARRSRST